MKKKVLAAVCAVVLSAGLLAGCGDSAKEEKKEETKTEETAEEEESPFADDTDSLTEEDMKEKDSDDLELDEGAELDDAEEEEEKEEAQSGSKAEEEKKEEADKEDSEAEEGIYQAEIKVKDYGTISVELDSSVAPITVENFVKLAKDGFYDGLTFHRIIDGFMIQGGDPKGDGTGGSEETIKGEFSSNGVENKLSHKRGVISMARSSDPDSASSQFFIVQTDATYLDGDYAAFGTVTEGMDVVDKICQEVMPLDYNGTVKKDEQPVIESITILE